MTDVLGWCESWTAARVVVRRDDGVAVAIPVGDIVAGKQVPPRPTIRSRVSPVEAQRRSLALFPDAATTALGTWVLRSSDSSPARRANSALAMTTPGVPDPVDAVVAHYEALGKRPTAMVLPGSAEEARFAGAGWDSRDSGPDACFLIAGVAHALRGLRQVPDVAVDVADDGSGLVRASIRDAATSVVARAGGAYADDWVGIGALEVDPRARRRGLASALLAEILEWAALQGARTAYLHVLEDNIPALALYGRVGFVTHHTYRYLTPPR